MNQQYTKLVRHSLHQIIRMNIKNTGYIFEKKKQPSVKNLFIIQTRYSKIICGLLNSYRSSYILLNKLKEGTRVTTSAGFDFDSGVSSKMKTPVYITKRDGMQFLEIQIPHSIPLLIKKKCITINFYIPELSYYFWANNNCTEIPSRG